MRYTNKQIAFLTEIAGMLSQVKYGTHCIVLLDETKTEIYRFDGLMYIYGAISDAVVNDNEMNTEVKSILNIMLDRRVCYLGVAFDLASIINATVDYLDISMYNR